jgi:GntR family transcriptional repressor for pyruvate dehydrogenase complex
MTPTRRNGRSRHGAQAGGSLVDAAIEAVTRHIREQNLRVGDALPGEASLAGQLGVSRAVMREAFGALAALNVIDVANGRRARVAALDGSAMATSLDHAVSTAQITVSEVWEVRRTIEVRTAALAAACRTDGEAGHIMQLADAIAASGDDLAARTRHDIAFHEAIARASHNALFVQILTSFGGMMEVAVPTAWRTRTAKRRLRSIIGHHQSVARAIRDADPQAAAAAMSAHFDESVGDLLKATHQVASRRVIEA